MTHQLRLTPETIRRLRDVARLCARAEGLAARGRDWYDSDPELETPKLAADSVLSDKHRDPVWRGAIAMRHRIAHDYDAVDYDIVWRVISLHARELRARVEDLLDNS
ncbi:MAG: hypothetical protein CSB46_01805 [Micrococcales bacterium]|nr:MAG: hypothetical protein CSB46_01805 [Micrococcales bacterium]